MDIELLPAGKMTWINLFVMQTFGKGGFLQKYVV